MPISGKKILKLLKKSGWVVISQSGSHVKVKKGKLTSIIPIHGNTDLGKGLIKEIEKQTGEKIL